MTPFFSWFDSSRTPQGARKADSDAASTTNGVDYVVSRWLEVVVNLGSNPSLFGDRLRAGYDKPAFQFNSGVGEDRRDFLKWVCSANGNTSGLQPEIGGSIPLTSTNCKPPWGRA